MKQDEKQDNLTLSQPIQLRSLPFSRQRLFQRQVSDFMKALFFSITENGRMSNRENLLTSIFDKVPRSFTWLAY